MSYITHHPGNWKTFLKLKENSRLSLLEIKQKYLKQQYLFETSYVIFQQQVLHGKTQGGKKKNQETPEIELITQNSEFIITQDGKLLITN